MIVVVVVLSGKSRGWKWPGTAGALATPTNKCPTTAPSSPLLLLVLLVLLVLLSPLLVLLPPSLPLLRLFELAVLAAAEWLLLSASRGAKSGSGFTLGPSHPKRDSRDCGLRFLVVATTSSWSKEGGGQLADDEAGVWRGLFDEEEEELLVACEEERARRICT